MGPRTVFRRGGGKAHLGAQRLDGLGGKVPVIDDRGGHQGTASGMQGALWPKLYRGLTAASRNKDFVIS